MRTRIFFGSFIFIIIGVVIGVYFPYVYFVSAFCALISLIIFIKNRPLAICALLMAVVTLVSANIYCDSGKYYTNVTIEGTVSDVYVYRNGRATVILDNCNHAEIGKTKVEVLIYNLKEPINRGNRILVKGKSTPARAEKGNPGDFPIHYLADGIKYKFYTSYYQITDDNVNLGYYFANFKEKVRGIVFENIKDPDSAAVLYAMVSGDKDYISDEIINVFSKCGTSHLLAVSGLHISIFLSIFILLIQRMKIKKTASLILIGTLVFVYSAFTGFSSSVLRAAIMALAANLSMITGEKYDSLNSLGFAGSCIVLLQPYRIFNISFQLSFLACFGIAWIIGLRKNNVPKMPGALIDAGLISVGATVFTLPVQIYYFGTVSAISLIANVLLVSVASFALILVFAFVLLALVWAPLGMLLHIPGYIMLAIIKAAKFLSASPQIVFRPVSAFITIATVVLMVFFSRFIRVKYKRIVAGLLLIILPLMWINTAVYHNNHVMVGNLVFEGDTCVHIKDDKNYILGLVEEKNIEKQVSYINQNIGKADVLVLLDYEDMQMLETAVGLGLKFDKLYAARFLRPNKFAKNNNMEIVATLKTKKGEFDFSQEPFFICGDESVDINQLLKEKIYKELYIRSH